MRFQLHQGDCLQTIRAMPDNSVDSIVTDPPYGLSFMGKRWDYDVPSVEIWAECLRVLKPGGHLLAFAGTRTQHRMAVRIEDAGFEIRDMIAWFYGSGFPKSLDVSKAIDKALGVEPRLTDKPKPGHESFIGRNSVASLAEGGALAEGGFSRPWMSDPEAVARYHMQTEPGSEAARQWQGWGTALKPALEPITVARKPLTGTVAENVLAHGTGALNIDGCRVGTDGGTTKKDQREGTTETQNAYGDGLNGGGPTPINAGRWPANLIHDGSEEVLAGFPQSSGGAWPASGARFGMSGGERKQKGERQEMADTGSAARFFYCAKASRSDRDEGLDGFEAVSTMRYGEQGQGPESQQTPRKPVEQRNIHPTVKPTDLMRYLCRLVTPPGGTVLDPFMGSGSTGKAAMLEGFQFIGCELSEEYIAIARARIEAACAQDDKQQDLFA